LRPERGGERRRGGQIGIAATAAGAGRDEGRERGEGNVECMRETGKVMEVRANWGIETGRSGQDQDGTWAIYK